MIPLFLRLVKEKYTFTSLKYIFTNLKIILSKITILLKGIQGVSTIYSMKKIQDIFLLKIYRLFPHRKPLSSNAQNVNVILDFFIHIRIINFNFFNIPLNKKMESYPYLYVHLYMYLYIRIIVILKIAFAYLKKI